jgi:hypothetical protein
MRVTTRNVTVSDTCPPTWYQHVSFTFEGRAEQEFIIVTLTLDMGTRELDATHLLMVLYNSVKFDSNPFNSKEVMAKTRNTVI